MGNVESCWPDLQCPMHLPQWLMEAAVLVICSPPGLALPVQMTLSIMSCGSPNKRNTVLHCGKCAQAQEPKWKEKGGLQHLNYCSHETIGLRRWLENEAEKRHYDFCYDRFLWFVLAHPGAKNFTFCDGKSKTSEKIKTFSWKVHLAEFTFSFSKSSNASMGFLIHSASHI